jgi:hypothetical protein
MGKAFVEVFVYICFKTEKNGTTKRMDQEYSADWWWNFSVIPVMVL